MMIELLKYYQISYFTPPYITIQHNNTTKCFYKQFDEVMITSPFAKSTINGKDQFWSDSSSYFTMFVVRFECCFTLSYFTMFVVRFECCFTSSYFTMFVVRFEFCFTSSYFTMFVVRFEFCFTLSILITFPINFFTALFPYTVLNPLTNQ